MPAAGGGRLRLATQGQAEGSQRDQDPEEDRGGDGAADRDSETDAGGARREHQEAAGDVTGEWREG